MVFSGSSYRVAQQVTVSASGSTRQASSPTLTEKLLLRQALSPITDLVSASPYSKLSGIRSRAAESGVTACQFVRCIDEILEGKVKNKYPNEH